MYCHIFIFYPFIGGVTVAQMILKDPVKEECLGGQGQSCAANKPKPVSSQADSRLRSKKDSQAVIVLQPGSVLRIEQQNDVKQ